MRMCLGFVHCRAVKGLHMNTVQGNGARAGAADANADDITSYSSILGLTMSHHTVHIEARADMRIFYENLKKIISLSYVIIFC